MGANLDGQDKHITWEFKSQNNCPKWFGANMGYVKDIPAGEFLSQNNCPKWFGANYFYSDTRMEEARDVSK